MHHRRNPTKSRPSALVLALTLIPVAAILALANGLAWPEAYERVIDVHLVEPAGIIEPAGVDP